MSMRKLPAALILAVCAALCVLLASCSAPSSGGELGGLTRISLTEHAAGPPGSVFLSRRPGEIDIIWFLTPLSHTGLT